MGEKRSAEESGLLRFADRWALMERVVAHGFDGLEDPETTAAEHFQVDAQAAVDHF